MVPLMHYFGHNCKNKSAGIYCLSISHLCFSVLSLGVAWPEAGLVSERFALSLIFVLCTALLILNPIIYYLNPSAKRNPSSRCVYVNNTKRLSIINGKRQKKKKIKVCGEKSIRALMPW